MRDVSYRVDYLRGVGVSSLKYYIGTHAHLDHVGGAPRVMAAFPPGEVLQPYYNVANLIRSYASTAEEKQVTAQATYRDLVWGSDYPGDVRTVDVHIRRLREKIEADSGNPVYVHTKWGVGYYFLNKE